MKYYVYANLEGTFVLQCPEGEPRPFNDILEALAFVRERGAEDAEVTVFDAFGRVALSSIRVSRGVKPPPGGDGRKPE